MTAARATAARTRSGSAGGRAAAAALLLLAPAAEVALAPVPARAAERVVTITPSGVVPSRLELAAGDTVRFVSQDPTFAYRAESTGGAWSFDSGPTELLDGDYAVPAPVVQPGTYTYRVAQDEPFHGSVVVPGAVGAPAPAGSPAGAGTSGSEAAPPVARAVPGQLSGADTGRSLGLPVALAALLVLGAASLLVRVVLTEAALSAPERSDPALSDPGLSHPGRSDPGRSDPALSDASGSLPRNGGRGPRW